MDELLKTSNLITAAIVGIAAYVLWPMARPLAKTLIKGGLWTISAAQGATAGIVEYANEIRQEAAAELDAPTLSPKPPRQAAAN